MLHSWLSYSQTLLGHGAHVDATIHSNGATPLYVAAQKGHSHCVEVRFGIDHLMKLDSGQILGFRCISINLLSLIA